MAIISRLAVLLGLDSAEFNAGLGKAETKLAGFKGSTAATGIALGALGAAFSASAIGAAKFADQINDVAVANEVSVGSVLKLSEALTLAGGKSEDAGRLFAAFSNKIEESLSESGKKGRESFQKLGVTLEDLKTLNSEDLFGKTLQGLAQIEDPLIRNARAADVFGKAVKGVDIKGLNEEFQNNKTNYKETEKAFKDIAAAMDILDKMTFKLKVSLATNIGAGFKNGLLGLNAYMEGLDKLNIKQRALNALLSLTPFGAVSSSVTAMSAGAKSVKEPSKPEKSVENVVREVKQLKEVTDAANKAKKDAEKELADAAKDTAQWAIKREADERSAREARAKEVVQMVIKQHQLYETTMKQAQLDKERLEYQKTLVNMSDTQRDKALALFDIEKEMVQIQKQNPAFSPDMLERIKQAKTEAVLAQEELTRAQNTFQAGWNRAYENFVERAKDSASIGASAFQSMASSMESALDNFVRTGKLSFSDLINSMISDLLRMMMKAQVSNIFGSIFGGGEGMGSFLTSSSTNFGNGGGLLGFLGFADGGEPPVGVPSIVGERGAELFVPKTAGTIVPNHSLSQALGSQPQTVYNGTVVQNLSAIDTQSAVQFLSRNKNAVWSANQSAQRSLPMSRG
jgi:lambda family phage tail tape measure protein